MLKEFKEFALKGNVMNLAVGVVIGAAFGKIVASLVSDIIMPLLSLITGKINFQNLFFALDGKTYENIQAAQAAKVATINYGTFISNIIDFLIIAFSIFIVVKQLNKFLPKKPVAEPTTKTCPFCQSNINIKAVRCPECTSQLEA